MKDYKNKILVTIFIGTLIVGSGIWHTAEAADASVYAFPKEASKEVGDTFDISIKVDPNGQKVCAVEGKLNLSKLTCQKITMGSGISSQTAPSCDNLNFLLGIQGCSTSKKTLFTIRVKAKDAGSGAIKFTGVDIIGEGVSLSSTFLSGSYTITTATPSCVCGSWSSWQDKTCGGGDCISTQRLQTHVRTCAPSGCLSEKASKCVYDSACAVVQKSEDAERKNVLDAVAPEEDSKKSVEELEQTDLEREAQEKEWAKLDTADKDKDNTASAGIPEESFLASIGNVVTQSIWFKVIAILSLLALAGIGVRQWLLSQKKK